MGKKKNQQKTLAEAHLNLQFITELVPVGFNFPYQRRATLIFSVVFKRLNDQT